jgi:hypothetical protein
MKKIMMQSELNLDAQFKIYSFFSMESPRMWMISYILSSPAHMHVRKRGNNFKKKHDKSKIWLTASGDAIVCAMHSLSDFPDSTFHWE